MSTSKFLQISFVFEYCYWKTIQNTKKKHKSGNLFNKTYTYKVHLICIILHPIWLQWGTKTHGYTCIGYQQQKTKNSIRFSRFIIIIGLWLVNRQVFRY